MYCTAWLLSYAIIIHINILKIIAAFDFSLWQSFKTSRITVERWWHTTQLHEFSTADVGGRRKRSPRQDWHMWSKLQDLDSFLRINIYKRKKESVSEWVSLYIHIYIYIKNHATAALLIMHLAVLGGCRQIKACGETAPSCEVYSDSQQTWWTWWWTLDIRGKGSFISIAHFIHQSKQCTLQDKNMSKKERFSIQRGRSASKRISN